MLLTVSACGADDAAPKDPAAAELSFAGQVDPLGGFAYDSGLQPADSPVQVQLKLSADAQLAAEALAVALEGNALAGRPGSGLLDLSATFVLDGNLKVDVSGLNYEGDIPGLESVEIAFADSVTFDPFALEMPVVVTSQIPETKLPDIPLPGGLPGVLSLTIMSDSSLTSSFQGTCAANDGAMAQYHARTVTSGTITIAPTVVLEIPLAGDKEFALPPITAPVPEVAAALDLGTVPVLATTEPPPGAEILEGASCDDIGSGEDSEGSTSDSGSDSDGSSGDGGDLEQGLIARYQLEGDWFANDGVTLDEIGGHHGVCALGNCPGQQSGVVEGTVAAIFVGDSANFRIDDDPVFDASETGFTVSLWVRVDVADRPQTIIAKPLGEADFNSWKLGISSSGELQFATATMAVPDMIATASLVPKTWTHVVATFDGTTKKLFVDGVEQASRAVAIEFDTHRIRFGVDEDGGALTEPLIGGMDDVRIYSRALSSTEIAELATPEST